MRIYRIHDSKAAVYHTPFFCPNDEVAIRHIKDAANDLESTYGKHPEDFKLFHVGEEDEITGVIHPELPIHIANFHDLVEPF